MKWKQLDSKIVLDTQFFKVRKDIVELPGGEKKEWVYWDSHDSAMVIGMTTEKKLVMIKQYRYLVDDDVIEFPSGGLDKEETPEQAAVREFEEESGFACANLVSLGSFYETYGSLNRRIHLFFSKDLIKSAQKLDTGEKGHEDIEVMLVDYDEAMKMAMENKISASASALAMLMLNEKIARKEISLD